MDKTKAPFTTELIKVLRLARKSWNSFHCYAKEASWDYTQTGIPGLLNQWSGMVVFYINQSCAKLGMDEDDCNLMWDVMEGNYNCRHQTNYKHPWELGIFCDTDFIRKMVYKYAPEEVKYL